MFLKKQQRYQKKEILRKSGREMGQELEKEERGFGLSILICLMKFSMMKRMWLTFFQCIS